MEPNNIGTWPCDKFATPTLVWSIDPALREAGLAVWYVTGGRAYLHAVHHVSNAGTAADMARALSGVSREALPGVIVAERMQSYRGKGARNRSLDDVRDVVVGLRALHARATWVELLPAQWKGQIPKDVHHARILAALGLGPMAWSADQWDAVGLGAFALGLTRRGGGALT